VCSVFCMYIRAFLLRYPCKITTTGKLNAKVFAMEIKARQSCDIRNYSPVAWFKTTAPPPCGCHPPRSHHLKCCKASLFQPARTFPKEYGTVHASSTYPRGWRYISYNLWFGQRNSVSALRSTPPYPKASHTILRASRKDANSQALRHMDGFAPVSSSWLLSTWIFSAYRVRRRGLHTGRFAARHPSPFPNYHHIPLGRRTTLRWGAQFVMRPAACVPNRSIGTFVREWLR